MPRFSAYLSVYNDWDLLQTALESIKGIVSELVVVDGAHEWMAQYYAQTGRDPSQSDPRLYEAIADQGFEVKILKGTWRNEVEKRKAGYEACTGDYIFRIDADEIFYFDQSAFERFLVSGGGVAEMQMPLYDSPGYIQVKDVEAKYDCQPFLFKASSITADQHLHYLWLVLTVDRLREDSKSGLSVFEQPIAFNAHLTQWRGVSSSTNRAAFYVLNWARENGFPAIPQIGRTPIRAVEEIFPYISAERLQSCFAYSRHANNDLELSGRNLKISPLSARDEEILLPLYAKFEDSRRKLSRDASETLQYLLSGSEMYFYVGGEDNPVQHGRNLKIKYDAEIGSVQASYIEVSMSPPFHSKDNIAVRLSEDRRSVGLTLPECNEKNVIRSALSITIWLDGNQFTSQYHLEVG